MSKKGIPAAAKGQRDGHVWIAAENDNFNKILVALGLWGEQSAERAKLFRLNPHLPAMGGSGANTPLKAGTSAQGRQSPPDCRQHYFLNLGIAWCLPWAGTPAYM